MPTFLAGKDNKVLFGAFDLSFFNSANFSREQASVKQQHLDQIKQPIFLN